MNLRTKNRVVALTLVLATARLGAAGAQDTSAGALLAQRGGLAESILAAKERALGEPFGASMRASLKSRMESLSLEQLKALAEQGESANLPLALGSVTSDLVYTPVTPCRVFDSRPSQGGPGPIAANSQWNVFVAGTVGFPAQGGAIGGCGVPVGATSAIINFVTVLPAGPGNIRAWAVADPQPPAPLAAVMNYGSVVGLPAIANGVAVPLCNPAATSCTLGDLRLQADTSATNILGDVVGYFGAAAGLVTSVNSITGPVTITAGSNISVTPSGSTLTIANTAPVNAGTVTSVETGAGLTGGPVTTTGALSVATGGIATDMLADSAVTSGKIASGAVGAAQINQAQVQSRVAGACAVGEAITAIAADGGVTCGAAPTQRVIRYNLFDTYLETCCWAANDDASLFGGVNPSTWTDNNGMASSMSSSAETLRTLFNKKLYPGNNALVSAERWRDSSSTNGKVTVALLRIRNSTGGSITWTPMFYFTAYAAWGERASIAVNGVNVWNTVGDNHMNSTAAPTLTIPGNATSTVIWVVPSSPPWIVSGTYYRMTLLAFYNNSLALPAGLTLVDDLESLSGNLW